ncbi:MULTISPECIES: hypothetical protein [Paenibacillus]|uniref:hypothetical protein n=1 Tax=Paenibacillus TaxID=44249 RepID=UPI0004AD3652|nr:hypothetical protein [Paenibacillus sp. J14]
MEINLTRPLEDIATVIGLLKADVGETLLGVTYLVSPEQLIEISAVAHLNSNGASKRMSSLNYCSAGFFT